MDQVNKKLAHLLLIDDSFPEILLAREYLKNDSVHLNLTSMRDGQEFIHSLENKNDEGPPFKPDLILLDINMPTLNGREILSLLAKKSIFEKTPVVMYSGSEAHRDIEETRKLGASGYIIKPLNFDKLSAVVEKIPELYFKIEGKERYLYRSAKQPTEQSKDHEK